jgi:hypothetical protein
MLNVNFSVQAYSLFQIFISLPPSLHPFLPSLCPLSPTSLPPSLPIFLPFLPFLSTGSWTQCLAFSIQVRNSPWVTPPAIFALVILEIRILLLARLAWFMVFLFCTSHFLWDDKSMSYPACFSFEMGVSQTFCPVWPGTCILSISVSQKARIARLSHRHLSCFIYLFILPLLLYYHSLWSSFSFEFFLFFSLFKIIYF